MGVVLAAFTQLFTFIAPRMARMAALYGTLVSVFAVLAWLSIGLNVLMFGASWTRVRALVLFQEAIAPGDAGGPPGTPAEATEPRLPTLSPGGRRSDGRTGRSRTATDRTRRMGRAVAGAEGCCSRRRAAQHLAR